MPSRACRRSLISLLDPGVTTNGNVIGTTSSAFAVAIEAGCNGVEATLVLVAAMLAFPATWRHRLAGIVVGIVAVQALNIVRVISLFYLGQWNHDVFEWAHLYVWQALIMLDVLIVWVIWVRMRAGECVLVAANRRAACVRRCASRMAAQRRRGARSSSVARLRVRVHSAWLPIAFAVWYFAAPVLLVARRAARRVVAQLGFRDIVRSRRADRRAIVTFVTALRPGSAAAARRDNRRRATAAVLVRPAALCGADARRA